MTTRVRILNEGPANVTVHVTNPALFQRDGSPYEVKPFSTVSPGHWHDEYLHTMQALSIVEGSLPDAPPKSQGSING